MPVQEEVDEINEFLQKRREKQRLGELPHDDNTPAIAKKISLAIFGKPREKEKPLLKSMQPTYASTEAQAAMRQQLDEIMDSHVKNTIRPAYAPTPPKNAAAPLTQTTTPTKTTLSTTPAPAPRVPHYYADMPYPPYIQRGLANYAKFQKKTTNTPSAAAPTIPVPPTTFSPNPAPRWPASAKSTTPAAPPSPVKSAPIPTSTPAPVRAPVPTPASAPLSSPARTVSPPPSFSKTPLPSPAKPPLSTTIPTAQNSSPPKMTVNASTPKPIPFWKKLLGEKTVAPKPITSPSPSISAPITPATKSPAPSPAYAPIPPMASMKTNASMEAISPVNKTISPAPEVKPVATTVASSPSTTISTSTPASRDTNPLLPVKIPTESVSIIPPGKTTEFARVEKKSAEEEQRAKRAELLQSLAPKPVAPAPTPVARPVSRPEQPTNSTSVNESTKYVPPWVSRNTSPVTSAKTSAAPMMTPTTPRETTVPSSSSPSSSASSSNTSTNTLPWKQPFGTSDVASAEKSGKRSDPSADLLRDAEKLSREKKIASGEIIFDELEKENARATPQTAEKVPVRNDHALEQEISEEEALEKLPFEEVEGLSESDLDYLSRKEKEHRAIQEKEEGDVGDPRALKDTLQRQTSELEGALQKDVKPSNDEKQEILKRLKQMMEEEHR